VTAGDRKHRPAPPHKLLRRHSESAMRVSGGAEVLAPPYPVDAQRDAQHGAHPGEGHRDAQHGVTLTNDQQGVFSVDVLRHHVDPRVLKVVRESSPLSEAEVAEITVAVARS